MAYLSIPAPGSKPARRFMASIRANVWRLNATFQAQGLTPITPIRRRGRDYYACNQIDGTYWLKARPTRWHLKQERVKARRSVR